MSIYKVGNQNIDGLIPNTQGERAFPTHELGYEAQGQLSGTDPFIMLDHIGPSKMPANWRLSGDQGIHPHRGFETITFMFKGNLHHLDTVFSERPLLKNGSVQQMNAGKGIRHGGDFWADDDSNEFHEVQLWVNSPAHEKMSEPYVNNYSAEQIPHIEIDNLQLRLIAGTFQKQTGPVKTFADIRVLHGTFETKLGSENARTIPLASHHSSQFLFVMTGKLEVNKVVVASGETLVLNSLKQLEIHGLDKSQFLLISGKPWLEPFAAGGPFVMNTQEQIQQAFLDAKSGAF